MNHVAKIPLLIVTFTLVALFWCKLLPFVSAQSLTSSNVTIDPTEDVPVEISDIRVVTMPYPHLEYKVSNVSQERLVALEITWHFVFPNGKTTVSGTRLDYLFDDSMRLSGGASERITTTQLPMLNTRDDPSRMSVTGATGKVTFAEFSNNNRLGSNREGVLPWLAGERNSRMDEYRNLSKLLRLGGEAALHQVLTDEKSALSEQGSGVRRELGQLEVNKGMAVVTDTLNKRVAIRIPE